MANYDSSKPKLAAALRRPIVLELRTIVAECSV